MNRVAALIWLSAIVVIVLGASAFFVGHAKPSPALAEKPKGVTTIAVKTTTFRPSRRYIGSVDPWISANIGPQFVSASVDEVLVRPGDTVAKGALLAKLACQHVAANSQALTASARATAAREQALADESKRLDEMAKLGFVSENERQNKLAESAAEAAQLASAQARSLSGSLEQNDCVLRAPFAGEIAERFVDPAAFVHPGMAVVTLIDRSKVRIAIEVPESDYDFVTPGAPATIRLLANNQELTGVIARRAPSASESARTIHCEVDLPNESRTLPTGTTAELRLDVGQPQEALELPLIAAAVRGSKATVFVVDGDVVHAKTLRLLGEREGNLFVEPAIPPQSRIVLEGRSGLKDGDHVRAIADPLTEPAAQP